MFCTIMSMGHRPMSLETGIATFACEEQKGAFLCT